MSVKKKVAVAEEVVAGFIYLLCVGLSLLPVGIMRVFNVWDSDVALVCYLGAAISFIFLLLEFLSFFLGEGMRSEEVAKMRIEVDMGLALKYYIPMLAVFIPAMFLLHASAFKEGKALVVVGLYALFSLVLFANLVLIQIVYLVESRKIIVATIFLNLILHQYPLFYMLITQAADPLIIGWIIFNMGFFVFKMFDRLW